MLLLPNGLELGHQFFPAFGPELKHRLFLGLKFGGLLAGACITGSPSSQAFRQEWGSHMDSPRCQLYDRRP